MSAAVAPVRSSFRRAVLMGDPAHFSVQGGANPHTRTWLGTRRRVDRQRAVRQWKRLRDRLVDLGVRVLVVPPDPHQPGLVYPANAGCLFPLDAERPVKEKTFLLANLLPSRAGERPHYRKVLEAAGFQTVELDERYRFEGEADFFPVRDHYLLTHGRLERQRFVPRLGIPPWKRVYGFRTDAAVEGLLAPRVAPRRVFRLELLKETHYHGDTALCAFGPAREHLIVWPRALATRDYLRLRHHLGHDLVELSDDDARRYAANSFSLTQDGQSFLVMPEGLSDRLLGQVHDRGVLPISVDVSEFLKKGGGSVKCMIGDLGPIVGGDDLGGAVGTRG
ncbi:MAG: arginine deiminase-related protein [Myxococcota bacterium]